MSLWAQQAIWDLQKQVKELEARVASLENAASPVNWKPQGEMVTIDKRSKAYRQSIGR